LSGIFAANYTKSQHDSKNADSEKKGSPEVRTRAGYLLEGCLGILGMEMKKDDQDDHFLFNHPERGGNFAAA
jgi:hypothetical protein